MWASHTSLEIRIWENKLKLQADLEKTKYIVKYNVRWVNVALRRFLNSVAISREKEACRRHYAPIYRAKEKCIIFLLEESAAEPS